MYRDERILKIISKEYGDYDLNDSYKSGSEENEHIQYPLYAECYKCAIETIFKNIYKKNLKSDFTDQLPKSPDNAHNIIAFCGERGSGKTTAISEFGIILKNLNKKSEKEWWMSQLRQTDYVIEYEKKNIQFIVLDSIDASLLTVKEDIIEMILAKMFEMFEKEMKVRKPYNNNDTKIMTEILQGFDNVYNSYHRLSYGENKADLGDSVSLILKNVPTGPTIRQNIKKLLDYFFELMGDSSERNIERYLVITIDDLDLNINKGYEILEQIRKYLSDLHIIVLVAVDYEQLTRVCDLYFERRNKKKRMKSYIKDRQLINEAESLAKDYLLKAIPIYNRIYMPDMRKIVEKCFVQIDGKDIDVKNYFMIKIVEKLGIYYDAIGYKKHFVVPATIRQLVDYDDFLDSLYTIDWKNYKEKLIDKSEEEKIGIAREIMYQYNYNFVRMNRDITNRMACYLLNDFQYKRFVRIIEKNILYRSQYAIEIMRNWMQKKKEEQIDNKTYRYGELLQILYELGRRNYEDKELVHCILAFLTSEMTKEYYSYKYSIDENEKETSKERIENMIGASFGNKWLGEIFPQLVEINDKNEKILVSKVGFIENVELENVFMDFNKTGDNIANVKKTNFESKVRQLLESNHIVEIIDSFLTFIISRDSDGDNSVPDIKFDFKEINNNKYSCKVSFSAEVADFDILGFIGRNNSVKVKNVLTYKILQGIVNGVNEVRNDSVAIEIEDCKELEKYISAVIDVEKESCDLVFPYYDLDLSYNVLKRVRENNKKRKYIVKKIELYSEIKKLYGIIAVELLKEDQKYGIEQDGFFKKFVESDFIQKFGIIYSNSAKEVYGLDDSEGIHLPGYSELLSDAIMALRVPDDLKLYYANRDIQTLNSTVKSSLE